eukprot:4552611-Pyramimonas_sp.AAC.1
MHVEPPPRPTAVRLARENDDKPTRARTGKADQCCYVCSDLSLRFARDVRSPRAGATWAR